MSMQHWKHGMMASFLNRQTKLNYHWANHTFELSSIYVAFKVGPALACGNTLVVKIAENAPLTGLFAAQLFHEVQLLPVIWMWTRLIQNSLRKSSDALDQVSNPMLIWNVVVKELARKAS
ncbi:hypothetical protein JHK85_016035 [Glycine max]|nr:hypothetical protein JHK85_016035 [Glycine max]